ncbi:TetR/AcrR family transcriptional regulator [Acidicapsa acidisoli]|uniref:TetR/AcrR family transcriptional regulator n=1 Tax=Acidicapsa acidisoli TaxID=1615681 RepID=UPI0021DF458D|nr:TetR family transcriptional regulator [Acidicapsa acidisoli]
MTQNFQRARSSEAKEQREAAILEAARALAATHGVRQITLTDIADAIGMHKSALLRYFETREQIFLVLTAEGWREWSSALRNELSQLAEVSPAAVSAIFAKTLTARPMFCDLLAQAPLNLERNVSLDAVRAFKLVALNEVKVIGSEMKRLLGLSRQQATETIATATSMAGALWQMATPGPQVLALYRSEPELAHAIVDVEPRLAHILEALITGYLTDRTKR